MPQQPNLFTPEPPRASAERPASRNVRIYANWLATTELLVRVIVQLYLGLLITALPWMRFWTENGLLGWTRQTAAFAGSGFVRGVVSGLGLLNVFLALRELFRRRKKL